MIDVQAVLAAMPHFETFLSVDEMYALVESLCSDSSFGVDMAGTSVNGLPIHDVRFGSGSVKALIVAGPHAMEPIGGLTVFSLMRLLQQRNGALVDADVEWHVVPCIDPDAALLNEGWYVRPWTFENYMRYFYTQPRLDQVDFSFPVTHKRLVFDHPSREAKVLRGILDRVQPDFYFPLHNYGGFDGAYFCTSRDIGQECYERIAKLLGEYGIFIQQDGPPSMGYFDNGVQDVFLSSVTRAYEDYEQMSVALPTEMTEARMGASSYDYLAKWKPDALVFIAELSFSQHSRAASKRETGLDLRQFRLRLDAESKFIATVILEEWENTKSDLDDTSPFYRKLLQELVNRRASLHEGVTEWYAAPTECILFSPALRRTATEHDIVSAHSMRTYFLCNAYTFVRLLNASAPTAAVGEAISRVSRLLDEAVEEMWKDLSFGKLNVLACDRLARGQLGSGLIALNSLLAGGGR